MKLLQVKLLDRLLEIQDEVLGYANRYLPMEKLDKHQRKKLLSKQNNCCHYCGETFTADDVIVLGKSVFSLPFRKFFDTWILPRFLDFFSLFNARLPLKS